MAYFRYVVSFINDSWTSLNSTKSSVVVLLNNKCHWHLICIFYKNAGRTLSKVDLTLGYRLWRWPYINSALDRLLLFRVTSKCWSYIWDYFLKLKIHYYILICVLINNSPPVPMILLLLFNSTLHYQLLSMLKIKRDINQQGVKIVYLW